METDPLGTGSTTTWPVTLRIGAVGVGVGVGCGVGIGFGQPLNLGALPGIGQAAQGISSGLSQLPGPLAGIGQAARQKLLALGIRGLDAGLGCGVGLGYGFGAGLMLNPTATEQLVASAQRLAGSLMTAVQHRLGAAGMSPKQQPAVAAAAQQQPPSAISGMPTMPPSQLPGSQAQPWVGRGTAPETLEAQTVSPGRESGAEQGQASGLGVPPSGLRGHGLGSSAGAQEAGGSGLAEVMSSQGVRGGGETLLATQAVLSFLLSQQRLHEELGQRVQALEEEVKALASQVDRQREGAEQNGEVKHGRTGAGRRSRK